jgi:hypothetical protein
MGYDTTAWTTAGNTLTIGGTTMYAFFGCNNGDMSSIAANTHYLVPFGLGHQSTINVVDIGTGTDPDTSLTTAHTASQMASEVCPSLWYLPDNVYIDEVNSLEGADQATGGTTRMHLMSYDFTSGSTSCLTNGTVLGYNSDVTNAGSEQIYLSSWTIDSPSVSSGKVIVVTFRADAINSDYSLNISIKYHLT